MAYRKVLHCSFGVYFKCVISLLENYSNFLAKKTHRQKMVVRIWVVLKFTLSWLRVNFVGPEANFCSRKLLFSVSIFILL